MRRAYALAMVGLVGALFVVAVVVNAAYTRHVQQQADGRYARLLMEQAAREKAIRDERDRTAAATRAAGLKLFCAWIGAQIDPDLEPVTTPRGAQLLAANRRFYKQIGCKGKP